VIETGLERHAVADRCVGVPQNFVELPDADFPMIAGLAAGSSELLQRFAKIARHEAHARQNIDQPCRAAGCGDAGDAGSLGAGFGDGDVRHCILLIDGLGTLCSNVGGIVGVGYEFWIFCIVANGANACRVSMSHCFGNTGC